MSDENVLRQYLRQILREEYFRRDVEYDDKLSFPVMKKIRNFFFGENADDHTEKWLESKEDYYDITFEDDFRDEVKEFSSKVYKKALQRTKDDKEKALKILKRTLDVKYAKKLKQLESSYLRDFEDE